MRRVMAHDTVRAWVWDIWSRLRLALEADATRANGHTVAYIAAALGNLGVLLETDAGARARAQRAAEGILISMLPAAQARVAGFIADVVGNWDSATITEKLELRVGSDLQYVRVNGTLVGFLVGGLLYIALRAAFGPVGFSDQYVSGTISARLRSGLPQAFFGFRRALGTPAAGWRGGSLGRCRRGDRVARPALGAAGRSAAGAAADGGLGGRGRLGLARIGGGLSLSDQQSDRIGRPRVVGAVASSATMSGSLRSASTWPRKNGTCGASGTIHPNFFSMASGGLGGFGGRSGPAVGPFGGRFVWVGRFLSRSARRSGGGCREWGRDGRRSVGAPAG